MPENHGHCVSKSLKRDLRLGDDDGRADLEMLQTRNACFLRAFWLIRGTEASSYIILHLMHFYVYFLLILHEMVIVFPRNCKHWVVQVRSVLTSRSWPSDFWWKVVFSFECDTKRRKKFGDAWAWFDAVLSLCVGVLEKIKNRLVIVCLDVHTKKRINNIYFFFRKLAFSG